MKKGEPKFLILLEIYEIFQKYQNNILFEITSMFTMSQILNMVIKCISVSNNRMNYIFFTYLLILNKTYS